MSLGMGAGKRENFTYFCRVLIFATRHTLIKARISPDYKAMLYKFCVKQRG